MGDDGKSLLDFIRIGYKGVFLAGAGFGALGDRLGIYLLGRYKEERAKEQAAFAKTIVSEMSKYLKENDKTPQA